MIPRPAQYILRCDDLCPTASRPRWQRFFDLVAEFRLQPILAVVPDNRDPDLELSPPDPEFWTRVRALESAGASIALHGYRHLPNSRGRSLVPLHGNSEFAGVPEHIQRQWIHEGLAILRTHGLNPRIWVAPRHGFDRNTLRALGSEGIKTLSDGLTRVPFTRDGFTWIPQQLWQPVGKKSGLWTICIHPNTASDWLLQRLHDFLRTRAGQFTSVDRVLAELRPASLSLTERLHATLALKRIQAAQLRKRLRRRLP